MIMRWRSIKCGMIVEYVFPTYHFNSDNNNDNNDNCNNNDNSNIHNENTCRIHVAIIITQLESLQQHQYYHIVVLI